MRGLILSVLVLFFLSLVSAQYSNPNLPNVEPPPTPTVTAVNNNTLNVNNTNCWQSDCGGYRNPFNQILNTTSNVTFNNLVANLGYFGNKVTMDLGDPLLEWISFTAVGGLIEVADLNFGLGSFVFQSRNNFNLFFATDDLSAVIGLFDNGEVQVNSQKGLSVNNNSVTHFATNATETIINSASKFSSNALRNVFVKGVEYTTPQNETNLSYIVNGSQSINVLMHNHNGTGVFGKISNETGMPIPHDWVLLNSSEFSFNTLLTNPRDRDIIIRLANQYQCTGVGCSAFITPRVTNSSGSFIDPPKQENDGLTGTTGITISVDHFPMFYVPAGRNYTVNTTTTGTGTVSNNAAYRWLV